MLWQIYRTNMHKSTVLVVALAKGILANKYQVISNHHTDLIVTMAWTKSYNECNTEWVLEPLN